VDAPRGDLRERRERRGLRLADDVHDRHAARDQVVGDDPAMAAPPHRFGAHDRDGGALRDREQFVEAGIEFGRQRVVGEVAERGALPGIVRERRRRLRLAAPTAERRDRGVGDRRDRGTENVGIELRVRAGPPDRADIDERRDPVRAQQLCELVDGSRRVTDRVDGPNTHIGFKPCAAGAHAWFVRRSIR
jgi:hypothetical protein